MKPKFKLRSYLPYTILLIFCVIYIFPLFWMFTTSLKTNDVLLKLPPEWIPLNPTINNFIAILSDLRFLTFFKNTFIVSTSTTILSLVLAIHASYAFSRFKFPGSSTLQMAFLSTNMFPQAALLIALYTLYSRFNMINTYRALIFASTTIALPLSVWILKGFYDTIPKTLEEAAYIDGCSRYMTLLRIIVPLIRPGIIAVGIYSFLVSWDDFVWGLTLVNKIEMRTLTPGIVLSYLGESNYDWSKVMTASMSASFPVLLVFTFTQKYMVSGLTMGAVKG